MHGDEGFHSLPDNSEMATTATMSPGPTGAAPTAAPAPASSSSFGQFRLTTFVDATPKPTPANAAESVPRPSSADDSPPAPSPSLAVDADGDAVVAPASPVLQSADTSPQIPSTVAPQPPPASTSTAAPADAPLAGFGVFDVVPTAGVRTGARRDGRVRNPVPRKLKGKTDMRNGNFGVMHMDVSGGGREAAAEAAVVVGGEEAGWMTVVPPGAQQVETAVVPQTGVVHRTEGMSAEETKYEQARLLTLLRSISPLTVVDQICKALAFFGGIPGAPAPEDGVFPDSADANGSGALFVGWLSEIFPELERKAWTAGSAKAREVVRGKRPRGRPKGSKATKVRKDKGIKKGPKDASREEARGLSGLQRLRPASAREGNEGEDEWVDVAEGETIVVDNGSGKSPADASQKFASMSSAPGGETTGLEAGEMDGVQQPNPPTANMGKRRPGRPRGSRNRPKEKDADGNEIPAVEVFALSQMVPPSGSPVNGARLETPGSQLKRKPGRPSGSRTKSKESGIGESYMNANGGIFNGAPGHAYSGESSTGTIPEGLTAEERAVLEAFRRSKAILPGDQASAAKPAEKRKRGPGKANSVAGKDSIGIVAAGSEASSTPVMGAHQSDFSTTNPTPPPRSTSVIPPPPKRQRKSKDPAVQTIPQDTSIPKSTPTPTPLPTPPARPAPASHPQPPISVPSMAFSSAPLTSEQIIPPARPPAQGLEAHYERFANLQQQQQQQQHETLQSRQDQHSVAQSSPLQSSAFYTQQPRQMPSPYTQYQTHPSSRPYHASANAQMDPYRAANSGHHQQQQQQQQQQHSAFSPRQQQQPFTHFADSSFIDLPALESASGGAAYAQGVGRAGGPPGFGPGSAGLGAGFEAAMSESDLRERLLRGIGRR